MFFDDRTGYKPGFGARMYHGVTRALETLQTKAADRRTRSLNYPDAIAHLDQRARTHHPVCLPEQDRRDIENRGQFTCKKAIVFAEANQTNLDLRIWLEDIYDLSLINVYERTGFFEWLLKCGKDVDLFIIDADSFASDRTLMLKFCDAIRNKFQSKPIILLNRNAERNEFVQTCRNGADVVLQSPTSRTAVWLGVKSAMDHHHYH